MKIKKESVKRMNHYVTGNTIRILREKRKFTQKHLAEQIGVSDKTVSKWENGRGLPDITLLEPLAEVLQVSVAELLSGECVNNTNLSSNMQKAKIYVCPVCGNVNITVGEALISCCGITLPQQEAEEVDETHKIITERIDNEYYVTVPHEMSKKHYISFIAYVTSNKWDVAKQYPEGEANTRFRIDGHGILYFYCNRHGLFRCRV